MLRTIATLVLSAVLLTAQSFPMQFNRMPRTPGAVLPANFQTGAQFNRMPRTPGAVLPANFQAGLPGTVRSVGDVVFSTTLSRDGAVCVDVPYLHCDPGSPFMLQVECIESREGECVLDTYGIFKDTVVPVGATQAVPSYYNHVYVVFELNVCIAAGDKVKMSITLGGGR